MREYVNRYLNDDLFKEFNSEEGKLRELLTWIKKDDTLHMEFRGNRVDVYYRGGVILMADIDGIKFNKAYLSEGERIRDIIEGLDMIPFYKQKMDFWFCETKEAYEREFEQLICRVNNAERPGRYTDYFMLDMEFEYRYDEKKSVKPDLIAIEIPAHAGRTGRDIENKPHKLAFIEVKYGDDAIESSEKKAGVYKHFVDYKNVLCEKELLKKICEDMQAVFEQKLALGLLEGIHATPESVNIKLDEADYIYVLANRTPRKGALKKELDCIINKYNEDELRNVYIAMASDMGYGLYSERCIPILKYYKEQLN